MKCPCCGKTYDGSKGTKMIMLENIGYWVCLDCVDTYSKEDIKEKIRKKQNIITLLTLVVWTCILILGVEVW